MMSDSPFSLIINSDGIILGLNQSLQRALGFTLAELKGRSLRDLLPDDKTFEKLLGVLKKIEVPSPLEIVFLKKDKSHIHFQGFIKKIRENLYLLYGLPQKFIFQSSLRLIKFLKSVNRIITKAQSEEELFQSICQSLVEELGLRFVWVGVPDWEKEEVKPLYHYGYEEGYLSQIKISLNPEVPEGRSPTARAIQSGKISINPYTLTNPEYVTFREEALKRGYLSSVAITLYVEGRLKAILNIYADEPYYFDELQRDLLEELKEDLEFALKRLEKERYLRILQSALTNSDLLLFITNENFEILYVNPAVTLYTGYTEEELLGKDLCSFMKGEHCSLKELKEHLLSLSEGESYPFLVDLRKKNGEILYVEFKALPQSSCVERRFIFLGKDISLQISLFETIEKLREYDHLTGALSLRGFLERLKVKLELKRFSLGILVVLDLYQFAYINDFYGFEVGDELLRNLVSRLKENFPQALIGRSSADEFVLFFEDLSSLYDLETILALPFEIRGEKIILKYNLGIALYLNDAKEAEELYRRANSACSLAKMEGPNVTKFYRKDVELLIKKTLDAERLIEEALTFGYFQFFFQPYFDTKSFILSGAESLIRIVKPNGEVVSPGVFIEVLEKSPLRFDFEVWAVKTIVEKVNQLQIPIGLNLYPKTFLNENFWKEVAPYLDNLKGPLVLEITERGFIHQPEKLLEFLKELKEKYPHLKIALDDFGTGYSNMSYLKLLLLDYLKIDIAFVRDIDRDDKVIGIVKNMIDLAHYLGARALAEGVERKEQVEILDLMGCDYLQGFYFEKPLPYEEFVKKYSLSTNL